ncbi:hypothetical protein ACIBCM_28860 [Streptomyces sp. NPDC051018]|uniref:hypothetical protein n=1 Tax=Streptomyces sp. NPDC051018 TaxID=3365639 RepID=UPI0037BE0388
MRGLRGRRVRTTRAAGYTAVAGLAVFGLFTASCSAGGTGVQDEGAAQADSQKPGAAPPPVASGGDPATMARKIDPVVLIQSDPKVSKEIKATLKPCTGADYPVDTSFGNLTGGTDPDVVVNLMTCGDAVGIGAYVYRANGERYENVFLSEEPAVFAAIDRGDLVVTKQVYGKEDPVVEPSGEEVTTYRWATGKFSRIHWVWNKYRGGVSGEGDAFFPPETEPGTTFPAEPSRPGRN